MAIRVLCAILASSYSSSWASGRVLLYILIVNDLFRLFFKDLLMDWSLLQNGTLWSLLRRELDYGDRVYVRLSVWYVGRWH